MTTEFKALDSDIQELIQAAIEVKKNAYCPYSNFRVGAAVLCKDGKMLTGCNVENASYGLSICAERNVLTTAVAEGYREFRAMALAWYISLMSKKPAAQTTAAPKKGHSDPKTLPVPRPLSPRSGAAQKLPAPKPDSSGSGAAQRVVSGLRLRTTFSVAGGESVWGGGLCVAGGDLAWVGGRGSVRTVDTAGRITRTVSGVCESESVCSRIVRGDDGEVYVGSYDDRKISRVSAAGAVSTFSKLTFSPRGLTQLSSGRLLVCGGRSLYTVTGRGVQRVELGVDVEWAVDVSVNSKGDVAVADWDGRKVCILDGQYKHVGTYSPTKSEPFLPFSLTSDGENFVICDGNNRTIDTVDRRGVCLSVYPTADDCRERPWDVDMLPSNCVWVKFDGGHVCVYDQI
ncbi:hypothetical protein ScPMuIL_007877 [Solemya velum]